MKTTIFLFICILLIWTASGFAQQDQLIFSHKFHQEDAGASCVDCHSAVNNSQKVSDNLLPAMETCYTCHDEDDTDCDVCHTLPDEAAEVKRITEFAVNFAHKTHIDEGQECVTCHTGIVDKENSTAGYHLPSGVVCTDCHGTSDFTDEKTQCMACHGKEFDFKPANHTVAWGKDHGISWEIESNSCSHCHSRSYCIDCHQGFNLDRVIHPLNYRNSHGIDAKANKQNCLTCHREFSFCNDCHQIEMVMPKNHSFASWSNTTNGGMHAREAQYDFDYCQTCHSDANSDVVCVRCHGR